MSAWGYPPEPDWVGQMEVTCSLTDVERKVVTPEMVKYLTILRDGVAYPDPWAALQSEEEMEEQRRRDRDNAARRLVWAWNRGEDLTFSCTFEGETEVALMGGRHLWTCPVCGEDHDDEAGPLDVPDGPDTWKEAEGLA